MKIESFVLRNLLYMMMLGFFENVISFSIKITLIKSGVFGVRDFIFVTIRGFFIIFPIYCISNEEREYEKYSRYLKIQKEQKKRMSKKDKTRGKGRRDFPVKIKRIPHKSMFLTNPKMNFLFFRNKIKKLKKSPRLKKRKNHIKTPKSNFSKKSPQAHQDFKIYISSFGDVDKPVSVLQTVTV